MAYTTINKSSDYFNTVLYTGNAGTQSITGVGFQPDLNWTKGRNVGTFHMLTDAVRGATKAIQSNTTTAEQTFASGLTSFNSDGFTAGNSDDINGNYNYASWNWKAGSVVSGNTTGSGTSKSYTGSIDATAGFSIIKYQGNGTAGHTIPHRLSTTPAMIIVKNLTSTYNWSIYHKDAFTSQSSPGVLYLNTTAGKANDTNVWGNSTVTIDSTVFSLGDYEGTNNNNDYFVAYCFAEKTGYSKFGSYIGNGSTDGTFIYTGFKPAFILIKKTDTAKNWFLHDNKRNGYNPQNNYVNPNLSEAENSFAEFDFLSNGFKLKTSGTGHNQSGGTYIYMAFAEAPLVGTNGVTAKAR